MKPFETTSAEPRRRFARSLLAVVAAAFVVCSFSAQNSSAQTVNLSNLEIALADPDNESGMKLALWAGFFTQVYEYSMPFIELNLDPDDKQVSEFRMTIGDSAFHFDDAFQNVKYTNSTSQPQPGGYAKLGQSSSPGVGFTSRVENDGDELVIDFGTRGLMPGETVRFQVDLGADDPNAFMFPSFTSVLFDANAEQPDLSDNSVFTLSFADGTSSATTLPDAMMDPEALPNLQEPRDHAEPQVISTLIPQRFDEVIPEPTGAVLAIGAICLAASRRERVR